MLLQRWPGLQPEELRRYLRPNRSAIEPLPHLPGSYQFGDGFGQLNLAHIFLVPGYVDETGPLLNFTSPGGNAQLVQTTATVVNTAGTWYHPYHMAQFTLSNSANEFECPVAWSSLTNRTWWCDGVPLASNAVNELRAHWEATNGHTADCEAVLYVWQGQAGGPSLTITNPTADEIWVDGNPDALIGLAGYWCYSGGVATITWSNLTSGAGGLGSFSSNGGETGGTWVVAAATLLPLQTNTIMVSAHSVSNAVGVTGLVVAHIPEPWVSGLVVLGLAMRALGGCHTTEKCGESFRRP
jgi:hypothetical protein